MAEPLMRFAEHLRMLRTESDRAALIIAAAMLDELLSELLRSRLVPSASRDDSLFDGPNAPFSSFSARIDIASVSSAQSLRGACTLFAVSEMISHTMSAAQRLLILVCRPEWPNWFARTDFSTAVPNSWLIPRGGLQPPYRNGFSSPQ